MARKPKPFDVNSSWKKLILAVLLLNLLIVASFFTSTPERSPASTWITAAYKTLYKVRPVTDKAKLAKIHTGSKYVSREECIACHGTMLDSKVLLHRIHLTSELLPGLACHDCHQSISLETRSNKLLVRWVDEGVCKKCHSAFPGLNPNSPMKPSDFEADCTTCHSGNHAFRHDQPYLSQIIAPRECKGCHGGRVLPWQPAHERDDWLQLHGSTALAVGPKSCFKCHDFGLRFCDQCHKIKPPSHVPRETWLVQHPERARADTRACFTCHKAEYCKKCHVNHEPDWLKKHPAIVRAQGTAACMECHSTTFCSYCHSSAAAPAPVSAEPSATP